MWTNKLQFPFFVLFYWIKVWTLLAWILLLKNLVFATNLYFLIHISLQLGGANLLYFKIRLFDLTKFVEKTQCLCINFLTSSDFYCQIYLRLLEKANVNNVHAKAHVISKKLPENTGKSFVKIYYVQITILTEISTSFPTK